MEKKNEIVKSTAQPLDKITDKELIGHLENLGLIKELTEGEKNTYLSICKAYNLNPFKREVHVSKYNGQMAIITGYETYIKRAERSGVLDGWEVTTTGSADDNTLKATITIYRKDRSKPFMWEVKYSEYAQFNKEGKPTQFWRKAETMTKKVAMAQGFRLCFNDELGGMPYTSEEMPETQDIQHEEVPGPGPAVKTPAPVIVQPKTDPLKPILSPKAFSDAINRIAAGEHELIDMITATFKVSEEELAKLNAAKK